MTLRIVHLSTLPSLRIVLAASLLAGIAACKREEVQRTRVGKEVPLTPGMGQGLPEGHPPLTGGGAGPVADAPMPKLPVAWTTPAGWSSVPGNGMRLATLKPADGSVEVSVISLAGTAGGDLANVNRWRSQIGLGAVDEKALPGLRKTVASKAGSVQIYDFSAEGGSKARMVVGTFAGPGGDSWFFKMTGDSDAVGKAKPAFLVLMESLKVEGAK